MFGDWTDSWKAFSASCWLRKRFACKREWSAEMALFFSTTRPDCTSHNQCFKSLVNRLMKFCLIHHINLTFHQPTTTSLNISTIFFAGEIFAQPAGCRKCFPRVCQVPKHRFLCYRNKQTYFSLASMC